MGHVPVKSHVKKCAENPTGRGKRGKVGAVKTPEERGELAWWAYRTGRALELSAEQIAHETGRDVGTIRKAESDSRNMSRPLLRDLDELYRRVARERGVAIDRPPDPSAAAAPGEDAVAAAIRAQTDALVALLAGQRDLIARMDRRLELLEAALLRPGRPDPRAVEETREWAARQEAALAEARRTAETTGQ